VATIAALGALALVAAVLLLRSPGSDSDDDPDAAATPSTTSETTTAPTTTPTTAAPPETTTTTTSPEGEPPLSEVPVPPADMDANESSQVLTRTGRGQPSARSGDTITFQFIGRLADGTAFVNSWQTSGPVTFTLGSDELVSGFDLALQGLTPGDRAEVYVGRDAAYGATGNSDGSVPPDSDLAYLVDVIRVNNATAD
jgi:hypothetical protein